MKRARSHGFATMNDAARVLVKVPSLPGRSMNTYGFAGDAIAVARRQASENRGEHLLRRDVIVGMCRVLFAEVPFYAHVPIEGSAVHPELNEALLNGLPAQGTLWDVVGAHPCADADGEGLPPTSATWKCRLTLFGQ